MTMKINVQGNFSLEDLKEFARLLRKIERKKPNDLFLMFIDNPSLSFTEAKTLTENIYNSTKEEEL